MAQTANTARFEACRCGRHGKIICSCGESSRLFATKYALRSEINRLKAVGKITDDELPVLRQQVVESRLVISDVCYERVFQEMQQAQVARGMLVGKVAALLISDHAVCYDRLPRF